jgi:hypothetical protein
MSPATIEELGSRPMQASTVASAFGISVEELGALLGMSTIKPKTPFTMERQEEALVAFQAKQSTNGSGTKPKSSSSRRGSRASASKPAATTETPVRPTSSAVVSRDRRAKLRRAQQLISPRWNPTREDKMVMSRLTGKFAKIRQAAKNPTLLTKEQVVNLGGRPGKGNVYIADPLNSGQVVQIPLLQYRTDVAANQLLPVSKVTIDELAKELDTLSAFTDHGAICGDPLHHNTKGILYALLRGEKSLPLTRTRRRGEPPFVYFSHEHRVCERLIDLMSEIEPDIQGMEEGAAKDIVRVQRLTMALKANGNRLIAEFVGLEKVWDGDSRQWRPINGREVFLRARAITRWLDNTIEEVTA